MLKPFYTEEMLQQITENVDLIEYASQTMDLVKRGDNYFTCCPKHIDNTPSLSFNPEKNLFYCFSCGRAGGIIQFLKEYEGLSFQDAIDKAMKLANVDISTMCQSKTIAYLRKVQRCRQRKKQIIEHPIIDKEKYNKYKEWPITEWLEEGMKQDVLSKFGVRIDDITNRIVYPVYDVDGNLINIKGRTRYTNYKKLGLAKYINYFPVGTMDYFQGLNLTLPYVKEKGEIIIFESIKSVMLMYGWGYKNCASAEKHTLTQEQLELLAKLRVNIVFAYDSDVNYWDSDVRSSIDQLKTLTNVYIIDDKSHLLGGAEAKNSPADCGKETWDTLYKEKTKVI